METWKKCNPQIIKWILEIISFSSICKNPLSNFLPARWSFCVLCKHTYVCNVNIIGLRARSLSQIELGLGTGSVIFYLYDPGQVL